MYLGLASTVHDPAVAVVDASGAPVFAEAVERPVGHKRAWHVPPDEPMSLERVLETHVGSAELVAAHTWERRRWRDPLFRAGFAALGDRLSPRLRPTSIGQMNSFAIAGRHLEYLRHARDESAPEHRHYDHHLTHASLGAFGSGWDEAAVAIVDANGERASQGFFGFDGRDFSVLERPPRKDFARNGSLGVFYAGLCIACGFDPVRGEEWKVMGLAPYGRRDEKLYATLSGLVKVEGLRLRGDNHAVLKTLETLRRTDPDPMAAADLAFTGQLVFAERMVELLKHLHRRHPSDRLVLGGGCALNSAFNGQLLERTPFRELYVAPAPGDDGNALGAAWLAWREDHPGARPPKGPLSPFLGSSLRELDRVALTPTCTGDAALDRVAELLSQSAIVAVARGRAEYGPRALGNRSILADPRDPTIKDRINASVKRREAFRPFAPAILHERGPQWFEHYAFSPYMERALRFRDEVKERVPGVVHEDGTGRLQSVTEDLHPSLFAILTRFADRTDVPVLLNTSFNVMGKPIVHSVEDCVAVYLTSDVDALLLEDRLFEKAR